MKNTLNPNNCKTRIEKKHSNTATVMVATARIAVAQIDPSYSSGGDGA